MLEYNKPLVSEQMRCRYYVTSKSNDIVALYHQVAVNQMNVTNQITSLLRFRTSSDVDTAQKNISHNTELLPDLLLLN